MPALRKPTAVLEIEGAFERHPERRRGEEPNTGRGVGPPPCGFKADERRAWDQIVGACAPGVWQSSDALFLEQLARLIARSRRNSDTFGLNATTVLVGLLARAGMTPADRSKVIVGKDAKEERPKTGLAAYR